MYVKVSCPVLDPIEMMTKANTKTTKITMVTMRIDKNCQKRKPFEAKMPSEIQRKFSPH